MLEVLLDVVEFLEVYKLRKVKVINFAMYSADDGVASSPLAVGGPSIWNTQPSKFRLLQILLATHPPGRGTLRHDCGPVVPADGDARSMPRLTGTGHGSVATGQPRSWGELAGAGFWLLCCRSSASGLPLWHSCPPKFKEAEREVHMCGISWNCEVACE